MSVDVVAEVHEFRRGGVSVLEFGTQEYLVDSSGSGAQAITMLERFADRETGEDALVASIRAAARAEAHAAGLKARYAARLAASERLTFATHTGTIEVAAEEIALALRVTKAEAERLIAVGRAITGPFFATGEALDAGTVTFPKAWVIADCLSEIPLEVALPVETKALERAPLRTAPELRRDIERMLIEADPDHADDRAQNAVKRRTVGRPRPARDGMARMSVFLPAPDALTLDGALDAAATAAHAAGDTRTVGQLRADTLAAWAATAARKGTVLTTT
ncbi:MAG: 13E12 repeat family protein, partial [Actinomycetes bacterium]|nr:13E12 repeat family protein [Actinomycetes bacterium]MDX5380940.1 13E12 repeat family protein [Actinomycetes bacterium]MDX5400052.1 13E12 repeat family protein [Actinomycetes bacterium]MDX5450702.1 13E12 repeat family protein [Actinomycetes bacterium]